MNLMGLMVALLCSVLLFGLKRVLLAKSFFFLLVPWPIAIQTFQIQRFNLYSNCQKQQQLKETAAGDELLFFIWSKHSCVLYTHTLHITHSVWQNSFSGIHQICLNTK